MLRATPDSPRMFESDLIDYFSRTYPAVVPILFVPGALIPFAYAVGFLRLGIFDCVGLALLGFVTWTLTEYWLHRTLFHSRFKGPQGERVHFLIHGVHHRWPKDRYRLVMPPAVSISLYFVFLGSFTLIFGPHFRWPFLSGFAVGYMVYDMSHFAIHHMHPLTARGKRLRRHHLLHHFKDPRQRFGVSTMVWDWVFGTMPSEAALEPARARLGFANPRDKGQG
jgi:dihydroceramide fatty acyl 2-hydroxylase